MPGKPEPDALRATLARAREAMSRGEGIEGWFDRLYALADEGEASIPWDRRAPHPLLVEWTAGRASDGAGSRALVVGSGLGDDAEHVAALGFATTAFDVSPAAVAMARRRFPASSVDYRVADLLDPPPEWHRAFALVVESLTAQSIADAARPVAIARISGFLAPGGTLLVLATPRAEGERVAGPPWPLARSEVEAFASGGVELLRLELLDGRPGFERRSWRAELRRPVDG